MASRRLQQQREVPGDARSTYFVSLPWETREVGRTTMDRPEQTHAVGKAPSVKRSHIAEKIFRIACARDTDYC